ncbi:metallophosphoesterase family protein [Fredinandcohnia sp. 179-A 10B2 NHS]|uniref:metallophosphoesterase family protein n=1 Tax=Fredinandcohnia sp. 179-A 10B2 NHS TaxID=3235176 RepID=UPI0039A28874
MFTLKIAVIADTHLPKKAKKLPQSLINGIHGVNFIIHAGDWQTMELYEELSLIAPVLGVSGNVDTPEIKDIVGEKLIIDKQGYKIGVVHGHLGKKRTTPERALEAFKGEALDLILFGHSHIPYKQYHGKTLLFNPGSPTDKRKQPQYSYGILEFGETLKINHHFYSIKD